MSDIVERLRATDGTYDITTILDRCTEAADEIERLRAVNADMLAALKDLLPPYPISNAKAIDNAFAAIAKARGEKP